MSDSDDSCDDDLDVNIENITFIRYRFKDTSNDYHKEVMLMLEMIHQVHRKALIPANLTMEYFDQSQYICHIKDNKINFTSCLKDITKFFMESIKINHFFFTFCSHF